MADPRKAQEARGYKHAHIDLTAKQVRHLLDYEPNSGLLRWKNKAPYARRIYIGEIAGWVQKETGRIKVAISCKEYMAHRLIWLWMTGKWPKYEIDHINENKSDNRWKNLRQATSSQNHRNRGKQKNNTTGYKGVTFVQVNTRSFYIAGIKVRGKRHNLGCFKTAKEAYKTCCQAAKKLHGTRWSKYV